MKRAFWKTLGLIQPLSPTKPCKLTVDPEDAPDVAEYVELDFEKGDCVAINGTAAPAEVMRQLNALAGKHGIGRVDLIENRFVGMKSRGVYETPGGTILLQHIEIRSRSLWIEIDALAG